MNRMVKRPILSLLLAGSLIFTLAPAASAHETAYAPHVVRGSHYATPSIRVYPVWLRKDRDFHRWYVRSRYRYVPAITWRRLYTMYHNDVRYHRHGRHYYPYRQWQQRDSKRRHRRH